MLRMRCSSADVLRWAEMSWALVEAASDTRRAFSSCKALSSPVRRVKSESRGVLMRRGMDTSLREAKTGEGVR